MSENNSLTDQKIIVHVAPDMLKLLSTFNIGEPFVLMRDGLFYEQGFYLPMVRLAAVEHLPEGHFGFTISNERLAPKMGLAADERLVDLPVETLLARNMVGRPATNPVTGADFAIVGSSDATLLENEGQTIWNPLGYLILHLSAELRKRAWQLFDSSIAAKITEQMANIFPTLAEPVHKRFSLELRTRMLQTLIRDQVSIRNMRRIYQALIDYETIVVDSGSLIVFDERNTVHSPPNQAWLDDPAILAMHVRTHLKHQISHKLTNGQTTLVVYLLAPEVEADLSNPELLPLDEYIPQLEPTFGPRLQKLIDEEYDLSLIANQPAILTTSTVTPIVRALLYDFAPQIPVASYQELSPDMNIQPIGRLEWG